MVKICENCRTKNIDGSFWCVTCNSKLTDVISLKAEEAESAQKDQTEGFITQSYMYNSDMKYSDFNSRAALFKTVFVLLAIVLIIVVSYFLYNNFYGVGKYGDDYWFEGDALYTENGWVFTIANAGDCNFGGVVLSTNRYNKNPTSNDPSIIFSPIDIFCGFDNVAENLSEYPYTITMWRDRCVWSSCGGSTETSEYFHSHNTNTHIIPHNKEVSEAVLTIKTGDMITLNGSYVRLSGENEGKSLYGYGWTTDTSPGNQKCELILLDTLVINGISYGI